MRYSIPALGYESEAGTGQLLRLALSFAAMSQPWHSNISSVRMDAMNQIRWIIREFAQLAIEQRSEAAR